MFNGFHFRRTITFVLNFHMLHVRTPLAGTEYSLHCLLHWQNVHAHVCKYTYGNSSISLLQSHSSFAQQPQALWDTALGRSGRPVCPVPMATAAVQTPHRTQHERELFPAGLGDRWEFRFTSKSTSLYKLTLVWIVTFHVCIYMYMYTCRISAVYVGDCMLRTSWQSLKLADSYKWLAWLCLESLHVSCIHNIYMLHCQPQLFL